MMKRWMVLVLALCLALTLIACGGKPEATTAAPTEATTKAPADDLVEYKVEGVGVFHLPEGLSVEFEEYTEPLPGQSATFGSDEYVIYCGRFGMDAYEAAGLPLPADLEEYSTRAGVRRGLPEDATFAYDAYGNFATSYINEEGKLVYTVLLKGNESYGSINYFGPVDLIDKDTIAQWLSGSELE